MRPSRLIIGEIRGAEIADVLQAFHTGHPGGGATLHASSLEDVPTRLERLGALAGAAFAVVILGSGALGVGTGVILRHQVASAVDEAALGAADVSRGVIAGEPCGMARDLLQKAGVEMVLCEESEDSVVVQGRRTSGLHSVIATARAGVVDGGEK
jgi:hypothetical protein